MFRRLMVCFPLTVLLLTVAEARQPANIPGGGVLVIGKRGLESIRQSMRSWMPDVRLVLDAAIFAPRRIDHSSSRFYDCYGKCCGKVTDSQNKTAALQVKGVAQVKLSQIARLTFLQANLRRT